MIRRQLATILLVAVAALAVPASASAAFGFLGMFGTTIGPAEGQFFGAVGVASDAQGNVYVTDRSNQRVQKFNANGTFLRLWGWGVQDGASAFQVCTSGCRAGQPSAGDGGFRSPIDVAVDSAGFVYVVEGGFAAPSNHRVQKFDGNGNFVTKWGGEGQNEGFLGMPYAAGTDSANNVYVAEAGNNRVSKFTSAGTFVRMWGWGVDDGTNGFQVCTAGCQSGVRGFGAGQFYQVFGLAVAPSGQIYTLEDDSNRVQRWDADGGLFAQFDVGEGPGQYYLTGIEVDAAGFVYVVNSGGPFPHTFRRFTADGALTDRIVCGHTVEGVGAHPSGNLYVGGEGVRIFGEGGASGACDPDAPPPPGGGGGTGGGTGGGAGGVAPGFAFTGGEGVTINDGARYTNDPDVVLRVVSAQGADRVLLSNDGGFGAPVSRPIAATARYPWTLDRDPGRDERLPKTVYARFGGPAGTSPLTFTDDIILDTIAPTVVQATLSAVETRALASAAAAKPRKARRFTVRLRARDNASGVARLQLAANRRRPQKARPFKRTTTFRARTAPRYVRVYDAAGNPSRWRRLRTR